MLKRTKIQQKPHAWVVSRIEEGRGGRKYPGIISFVIPPDEAPSGAAHGRGGCGSGIEHGRGCSKTGYGKDEKQSGRTKESNTSRSQVTVKDLPNPLGSLLKNQEMLKIDDGSFRSEVRKMGKAGRWVGQRRGPPVGC